MIFCCNPAKVKMMMVIVMTHPNMPNNPILAGANDVLHIYRVVF